MQTYTPVTRGVVIGGQMVRVVCLPATGLVEVTAGDRSLYIGYNSDAALAAFNTAKRNARAELMRRQDNVTQYVD